MTRAWAPALGAVALVLAVFGAAWAARASEGRRALLDADTAIARGDSFDAIMAGRTAAEARCPWCTASEEGFARLERIARDAEAKNDDATAFAAWSAMRASILAISRTSTTSELRTRVEAEIARFGHRIDAAAVVAGSPPTTAASEEKLKVALADHDVPSGSTVVTVAAGAALFFFGALRFVLAGAQRSARRLDLATAAVGIAVAIAGVTLF